MNIREAEMTDIAGISQVHIKTWQTAYQGIMAETFLSELSLEEKMAAWQNMLQSSFAKTYVAVEGEKVVGFVRVELRGPERRAYLGSLYLLASYQGTGVGKNLLFTGLDYLKGQGHQEVFVEVLSENSSKYFYEKYGAQFKEEVIMEINQKELAESIYYWSFEK